MTRCNADLDPNPMDLHQHPYKSGSVSRESKNGLREQFSEYKVYFENVRLCLFLVTFYGINFEKKNVN